MNRLQILCPLIAASGFDQMYHALNGFQEVRTESLIVYCETCPGIHYYLHHVHAPRPFWKMKCYLPLIDIPVSCSFGGFVTSLRIYGGRGNYV